MSSQSTPHTRAASPCWSENCTDGSTATHLVWPFLTHACWYYSGTSLNGHPSIVDISYIWVPIVFPLASIQPLHNGQNMWLQVFYPSRCSTVYTVVCAVVLKCRDAESLHLGLLIVFGDSCRRGLHYSIAGIFRGVIFSWSSG